ncbi:unnamed protein product [Triticum turgidum subsp. durum]|uniref:Remorin C-terminal domain-containing protein n=1 Tax=Triticum turgidum subsp. durum TaxID=4567 RepID=A0A9R1C400_TRITD|nr:unnamed protein product [Triticum turgidum subsp. durum]
MSSSDPIDHMSVSERLQRLATPSAPAEDDVDVDADGDSTTYRDIHPSPAPAPLRQPSWDVASQRSLSSYSDEQFMSSSMGREFMAMADAGGAPADPCPGDSGAGNNDLQLARIGEHEPVPETETNPLAKATEKAQNEVARARRKAEEKRASAEAARGTKTARVMDLANFMKAVGRVPTKRSFFSFSSSS